MQTNQSLLALSLLVFAATALPSAQGQDWQNGGVGQMTQPGTTYAPPAGWPQDPNSTQAAGNRPPMAPQGRPAQSNVSPQQQAKVGQWFANYDVIRRDAQMNPQERAYSDKLLANKLSMFIPGQEKLAAANLLTRMVARYDKASNQLRNLQSTPETLQLQKGYFQYFVNARALFSDYLRVQENLMAVDQQGNPIAAGLMPRKQALEQLEGGVKQLDSQLRSQYNIKAYPY